MWVALSGYPPDFRVVGEVLGPHHHLYRLSAPLALLLGKFQGLLLEGSDVILERWEEKAGSFSDVVAIFPGNFNGGGVVCPFWLRRCWHFFSLS